MLTPTYEEQLISTSPAEGRERDNAFRPAPSMHRPAWLLAGAVVVLLIIKAIYDRAEKE